MDIELLSRIQFAVTVGFHYIYPPLSIGLGLVLVLMEALYLRTRRPIYHQMTRFWVRIFGLVFALGVGSGIVMEFEFGTNWSRYSRFVGDIFGSPLAAEGIFAFFLESGFLAILLFGWDRVRPSMHFLATVMVCLGAHFSAVWIIVANSWMQTPAAYHIVETVRGPRAEITDFWGAVFNPSTLDRLSHTLVAGSSWRATLADRAHGGRPRRPPVCRVSENSSNIMPNDDKHVNVGIRGCGFPVGCVLSEEPIPTRYQEAAEVAESRFIAPERLSKVVPAGDSHFNRTVQRPGDDPGFASVGRGGFIRGHGNGPSLGWDLDADLVTLSACETGLGRQTFDDGMLSLTPAFFAAGARNVVSNLWKVEDQATAKLMAYFYAEPGRSDPNGKPVTVRGALRAAQRRLRDFTTVGGTQPYAGPWAWGGFVAYGGRRSEVKCNAAQRRTAGPTPRRKAAPDRLSFHISGRAT